MADEHQQIQENATILHVLTDFLITLPPDKRGQYQSELNKFARWFGEKKLVKQITAQDIEGYIEQLPPKALDTAERIEPLKEFLHYIYKKNYSTNKLAHLIKIKKPSAKSVSTTKSQQITKELILTPEGYAALEEELKNLVSQRPKIAEEIRRAAADKDFRENAPLEAARELQGKIEGRIRELEAILKSARIITVSTPQSRDIVNIGASVEVSNIENGEVTIFKLVDGKEADPLSGKISVHSPTGKALMGHSTGSVIDVVTPSGIIRYKINKITYN